MFRTVDTMATRSQNDAKAGADNPVHMVWDRCGDAFEFQIAHGAQDRAAPADPTGTDHIDTWRPVSSWTPLPNAQMTSDQSQEDAGMFVPDSAEDAFRFVFSDAETLF
ncbi:MAG: hypothetical protein AAGF88_12260 [Pseudomonadota bacterium]